MNLKYSAGGSKTKSPKLKKTVTFAADTVDKPNKYKKAQVNEFKQEIIFGKRSDEELPRNYREIKFFEEKKEVIEEINIK